MKLNIVSCINPSNTKSGIILKGSQFLYKGCRKPNLQFFYKAEFLDQ